MFPRLALPRARPIPEDVRCTSDAAGMLEITEFQLFGIAYERWYGHGISEKRLEPYFVEYMFYGVVPHWVRQFCRSVLHEFGQGTMDPTRFGAPQPDSGGGLRGATWLLVMGAVVLALLLLVPGSGELPQAVQGCYFPPCY